MAKIRRVVRKVAPPAGPYFDEQLWPVCIAVVVLGGFLMGVSLAYQPLSGVAWYATAWPSLILIPLVAAGCIAALVRIDNRTIRRSLQLSIVLCAILHVALVVQMIETRIFTSLFPRRPPEAKLTARPPPKIIPDYRPTQLLPDEDRPRQDFELPIETKTPEPTRQPEQFVRQATDEERSPALPQPVPIAEQQPTIEPNVVPRQAANEVAPRLAAQASQLSRQARPSDSPLSRLADAPQSTPQLAAGVETKPQAMPVERQESEAQVARRTAVEPATSMQSRTQPIVRRSDEQNPAAASAVAEARQRLAARPAEPSALAAAPPTSHPAESTSVAEVTPRASTVKPAAAEVAARAPAAVPGQPQAAVNSQPATRPQGQEATRLATEAKRSASRSAAPVTSRAAARAADVFGARSEEAAPATEPARLALSQAQAGAAGFGRSPNFDSSLPGATSPALVASGAARRAEATQRTPTGDALSPAAPARIARSQAGAELPTATTAVQLVSRPTTAGAEQVAEVTASASAVLTRADSAAPRGAITAAKSSGETDVGPTQVVTEAGIGRASGGGQLEINFQTGAPQFVRRSRAGEPGESPAAAVAAMPEPATSLNESPAASEPAPATLAASLDPAASDTNDPNVSTPAARYGSVPESGPAALVTRSPLRRSEVSGGGGDQPPPPAIAQAAADRGLVRPAVDVRSAASAVADIPEVGPTSAVAQAELDHIRPGASQSPLVQGGDALLVEIKADAGPGGLGTDYTPEAGIRDRQARAESLDVQLRSARFLRKEEGGLPAVSSVAVVATDAFSSRSARLRGELPAGGRGSPSPQTEVAIERGLAFLARYQDARGGWSLQGFPEGAELVSDTAATALAVIAFQGAGYNHREFQYKNVVRGGIDFLIRGQKENGDLFVPLDDASSQSVWLYSHSLAAIALCEAYGMTQDPALQEPAQRAIDFIVASQHAERGGWRYSPGVSSDTSVTGWMMMALKSGELAGLSVPSETYAKIVRWLDDAQQSPDQPHLYRYNPFAPDTPEQRHGRTASKTMTAVGLLMRLYTGWQGDNPHFARGADFLRENLPAGGTPRQPLRDTYYWYYATQVMAHMGGEHWQAWNARLHPLLVGSQVQQGPLAGSWDPLAPLPDRWGPHAGRLYVTAMNLLSLEVQYRKLPLYGETVGER